MNTITRFINDVREQRTKWTMPPPDEQWVAYICPESADTKHVCVRRDESNGYVSFNPSLRTGEIRYHWWFSPFFPEGERWENHIDGKKQSCPEHLKDLEAHLMNLYKI